MKKTELRDKITDFIIKNPNPPDEQIHALAESLSVEPDVVEEEVYSMLTEMLKPRMTPKNIDPKQLKRGMEVEGEHTDIDAIKRKITLDHLNEISQYYTGLDKMEKRMKKK